MIEPTDEMVREIYDRIDFHNHTDDGIREGLTAALAIAERDLRTQIAYGIRADLVCCDIFERAHNTPDWEKASQGAHSLCYWGEAAARIADGGAQ